MERFDVDCLVIGAGVVGLAVARQLAIMGRDVLVLEKESAIGTQTSSRNSEVIHAGIYYPKNTLKASLCVRGKALLYRYCEDRNIPFKSCGKLIVATSRAQIPKLDSIKQQAELNGVSDLKVLNVNALSKLEPAVSAYAALLSPSTGVLDSHAYMLQLHADIENNGGQCVFNSDIKIIRETVSGLELCLNGGEALITAKCCINAAGLNSLPLLLDYSKFSGVGLNSEYAQAYYAKGSYFSYSGSVPFNHLLYPVPEPGGLGIHLTLDLMGCAKFGPDVEWLNEKDPARIDYAVDPKKRVKFYEAVRQYWPEVSEQKMHADYSGVRPKLSSSTHTAADFLIQGPGDHGIKGLVNLLGIESPGLTSSLAIAEYVAELIKRSGL